MALWSGSNIRWDGSQTLWNGTSTSNMSLSFGSATSSESLACYQGMHALLKIYGSQWWAQQQTVPGLVGPNLADINTIMANALAQYQTLNSNALPPLADNP